MYDAVNDASELFNMETCKCDLRTLKHRNVRFFSVTSDSSSSLSVAPELQKHANVRFC